MNKYDPGNYLILFFDEIGRKKNKTKNATCYLKAKSVADTYIKKYPKRSVVISRIMYNSLNADSKWGYTKK